MPEIGPPGSESGGRKRNHGTRPAAPVAKAPDKPPTPTGYAPLLDSTPLPQTTRSGPRSRHLHLVERVPKKEIARRLKLDVKTVRRAISRSTPPVRVSPPRPGTLDPWRERIRQWLREEPRLTAKRIRRLLLPMAGPLPARTVRRYVAGLRTATTRKEAFVHRSVLPGTTMEVDFGESWVDIAGVPCKVKYLVATLPFSNAYFAKAYPVERIARASTGLTTHRPAGSRVRAWCQGSRDPSAGRDREARARAA